MKIARGALREGEIDPGGSANVAGESPRPPRGDERRRRARRQSGRRHHDRSGDPLRGEPPPHDVGTGIGPNKTRRRLHPQPGNRGAGVADDAAAHCLDRLRLGQPPGPTGAFTGTGRAIMSATHASKGVQSKLVVAGGDAAGGGVVRAPVRSRGRARRRDVVQRRSSRRRPGRGRDRAGTESWRADCGYLPRPGRPGSRARRSP